MKLHKFFFLCLFRPFFVKWCYCDLKSHQSRTTTKYGMTWEWYSSCNDLKSLLNKELVKFSTLPIWDDTNCIWNNAYKTAASITESHFWVFRCLLSIKCYLISASKALWAILEQRTLYNLAVQNTVTHPRAGRIEPTISGCSGCSGHALLSARVQIWTNLFFAARTTLGIYDEATQALPVVCWEKLAHRLVTSLSLLLCISPTHPHTHTHTHTHTHKTAACFLCRQRFLSIHYFPLYQA